MQPPLHHRQCRLDAVQARLWHLRVSLGLRGQVLALKGACSHRSITASAAWMPFRLAYGTCAVQGF